MTAGVTELTKENLPGAVVRYVPPSPEAVSAAMERLYRAIYCLGVTMRQVDAERQRLRSASKYCVPTLFQRWAWLNEIALAAADQVADAAADARPFFVAAIVVYDEASS